MFIIPFIKLQLISNSIKLKKKKFESESLISESCSLTAYPSCPFFPVGPVWPFSPGGPGTPGCPAGPGGQSEQMSWEREKGNVGILGWMGEWMEVFYCWMDWGLGCWWWMNGWLDGWMDDCVTGWMDGELVVWMYGWMVRWRFERLDQWKEHWWMNGKD